MIVTKNAARPFAAMLLMLLFFENPASAMQKGIAPENQAVAQAAWDMYNAGKYDEAHDLTQKALRRQQDSYELHMLAAQILEKQGRPEEAKLMLDRVILAFPGDWYPLASRGYLAQHRGKPAEALADFKKALTLSGLPADAERNLRNAIKNLEDTEKANRSETLWRMAEQHSANGEPQKALEYGREAANLLPDSEVRNLQMAYLALRHGRDREATVWFEKGLRNREFAPQDANALLDAAYAHKRLGENEKLRIFLEQAIDLLGQKVEASTEPSRKDIEMLYDSRREHADLVRKWGWNTGLFYVAPNGGDNGYSFQGLTELYWQPYYENGKQLQIFGQLGETLAAEVFRDGSDTAWSALGVRYEPLSAWNLVLTLERLFKIGDVPRNDTRLRIGFSWDTGLELEPWVKSWRYITFFNEYVYSMEHAYSLYYGEMRLGRSFRADGFDRLLAVSPHLTFVWNHDSENEEPWRSYVGAGVHFRKWYREDRYNAPKSYLDVVLQYQFGLTDKSDDRFVLTLLNSF